MAEINLSNTYWKINNISEVYNFGSFAVNHEVLLPGASLYSPIKVQLIIGYKPTGWGFGMSPDKGSVYGLDDSQTNNIKITEGSIIHIIDGNEVNNQTLADWLAEHTINLNCNIDIDFSFEQTDCHWELTRFFRLTWDQADGQNLYYRLGDYSSSLSSYKSIDTSKVYTKRDSYIYELPLSTFTSAELVAARDADGWITLTVYNGSIFKTFRKFYLLELPPVITKAENEKVITTDFVIENPGEIKVSWKSAIELDGSDAEGSPDDLDGYSIEVFHCPKELDHNNPENFTRLDGLKWRDADPKTGMPTTGVYKLTRVPVNIEIEQPESLEGENENFSYTNLNPGSEVYIEKPLKTEFFFNPKHLDIKPSDHYKFVIHPYSHYGTASLISNEGTESDVYKVRPGFVHVKTANGWEAGQVWVYTEKGWIVAEAVYTKTADGWKEAI
jgi:hypothetical protein